MLRTARHTAVHARRGSRAARRPAGSVAPVSERLERLLNLVIALRESATALTAEDVRERVAGYGQPDADAFRRMFDRDKAALRELGVPVAVVEGWDGRPAYRVDPEAYDLPPLELTQAEVAALALATSAAGLQDEARPALERLAVDAGEPAAAAAPVPRVGLDLEDPRWPAIAAAQLARQRVAFRYQAPGRAASRRTLEPWALVHRRGRWYVVGRDVDREERRAFRLDRIIGDVEPVGEPGAFPAPRADVSVDDVVPAAREDGPAMAEVRAGPDAAWRIARRARGAGRPAARGDTEFTVPVGDPDAFVGWIVDLGPDVELVAPPDLRQRLVEHLRAVALAVAR